MQSRPLFRSKIGRGIYIEHFYSFSRDRRKSLFRAILLSTWDDRRAKKNDVYRFKIGRVIYESRTFTHQKASPERHVCDNSLFKYTIYLSRNILVSEISTGT